jgi:hypothetical protein
MANKTWLGGGNNQANNPNDWSPAGVPQFSDNMLMTRGTMNITDFDLGNDPAFPGVVGLNRALAVEGNATINLDDNAAVFPAVFSGHATINVEDRNNMFLQVGNGGVAASATVDLKANSQWVGGFLTISPGTGQLIINGAPHATFVNFVGTAGGSAVEGVGSVVTINADIASPGYSIGAFDGGKLVINGSVGSGTIAVGSNFLPNPVIGTAIISRPDEFHGTLDLTVGEIDLNGLARADSYSYTNDLLSIYAGGRIIDQTRLTQQNEGAGPLPFSVVKTHGGVALFTNIDPVHPAGTILPVHV